MNDGTRATLIYDGRCAFCRRWAERVRRWDRHQRIEWLPFQSPELPTRFPDVPIEACQQRIHLVDEHRGIYAGASAGREVLRRLPLGRLWSLPFNVPGALAIAETIYRWITHRWGPLPRR
jgi:predicted DCC family thiol-disulfide oxidoreductase YuxK